ncbi:MAG: class I SAM-dependent methyltransferase [Nannocystaceae bacterium]
MARRRSASNPSAAIEKLLRAGTNDHYEDATLYDFEYENQRDDVTWYLARAKQFGGARPLLELGAGTGRITLPLLHAGHRVVALDRKASMLNRLAQKLDDTTRPLVDIVEGDLCELSMNDRSMEMVIAPFNVLMHLYSWDRLLRCFEEVARVLRPGGMFCFDVLLPDLEWLLLDPDVHHCRTRFVHPETKQAMVYSTNHTYDHESQVAHIRIHYHDAVGRGARVRPDVPPRKTVLLAHRQIWPEELRCLLKLAGLELRSLHGDFDGDRLTHNAESQVVIAQKPKTTSRKSARR